MKIVLKELTKKFPNANKKIKEEVVAVDNFTFEIPDGKLIGLLGPSGCGKSTMLNMISGLLCPTSGKIFFGNTDVTDIPPEKRGVGLVFQNYALYPHMTVMQNILFPLQNLKGDARPTKEQMVQKAKEVAKLVQIDGLLDRRPGELSGGQQQRVAIARALVKMPAVLLLDEPLSNLDARLRLQTREEIRRIQNETGITTIFVTHDQEEAMSISDMIVVMKDGVLHQAGKPQEVYNDPADLFVAKFLGTPSINVFKGELKDGYLYIGDEKIMEASYSGVKSVSVGVRPEGLVPATDGYLTCGLARVETMGRDTSIVFSHKALEASLGRAIVDAEDASGIVGQTVKFKIRPTKIHVFDEETGDKIVWG